MKEKIRAGKVARNLEIIRERKAGKTYRYLAEKWSISQGRIYQIMLLNEVRELAKRRIK